MAHQKAPFSKVEALLESHDRTRFDGGAEESLKEWRKRFAVTNQKNESARTYIVHRNRSVVGYDSISAGSVSAEKAPGAGVSIGLVRHPIPVILLGKARR
jgi:hypothetical protein